MFKKVKLTKKTYSQKNLSEQMKKLSKFSGTGKTRNSLTVKTDRTINKYKG